MQLHDVVTQKVRLSESGSVSRPIVCAILDALGLSDLLEDIKLEHALILGISSEDDGGEKGGQLLQQVSPEAVGVEQLSHAHARCAIQ